MMQEKHDAEHEVLYNKLLVVVSIAGNVVPRPVTWGVVI